MTDLHGVSMFSGIGLLDLAMHRAGITPALLCEKDNAARQVLARHYPDVPIHDDVTELTAGDLNVTDISKPKGKKGSAWADREESTWIDKL